MASGDQRSDLAKELDEKRSQYFTNISQADYAKMTGNTTHDIFADVMSSLPFKINSYSVMHDNACGPGVATKVLVEWNEQRGILPAEIHATDANEAMVDALRNTKAQTETWKRVESQVMDSAALTFPNDHFSFVFCNFSVFNFANPLKCLHEVHRTLRPSATAVFTTWKRFGVVEVMRAAQMAIKPDAEPMPVAGPEFMKEGYLARMLEDVSFELGKIKVLERQLVVREGENLDNLVQFMTGKFAEPAMTGFTDEQKARWPAEIKIALEEEKKKHGGLLFEAWVVLARKWDAMYG